MNVLNPVSKVRTQFLDTFVRFNSETETELEKRVTSYFQQLNLPSDVLNYFPHQLSGGMRQRIVIAMATLQQPELILADEPTTALDVVVQKAILLLLRKLQRKMKNSLILVSHDMGVHYQVADRILIMYSGRVVESAPRNAIFSHPLHPYTQALIGSLPVIGDESRRAGIREKYSLEDQAEGGCPFYGRCPVHMDKCRIEAPRLHEVELERQVECHLY
jgi:peptide/nickel transport system ATP-binding protein